MTADEVAASPGGLARKAHCLVIFFVAILYAIGFVSGLMVHKTIDQTVPPLH